MADRFPWINKTLGVGGSIPQTFLLSPERGEHITSGLKVTSAYGEVRNGGRIHKGVDINTREGTELYPVGNNGGTVTCHREVDGSGNLKGWGIYARYVPRGENFSFLLAHLNGCKGGYYKPGDIHFAITGNTGSGTGPHLHIEQFSSIEGKKGEEVPPGKGWIQWFLTGSPPVPYHSGSEKRSGENPPEIEAFLDTISFFETGQANREQCLGAAVYKNDCNYWKPHILSKGHPHVEGGHPPTPGVNGLPSSTATGYLQLMDFTYEELSRELGITNLSTLEAQDAFALKLMEKKGVNAKLIRQDPDKAFCRVGGVWASFGCNNYRQYAGSTADRHRRVVNFYHNRLRSYK